MKSHRATAGPATRAPSGDASTILPRRKLARLDPFQPGGSARWLADPQSCAASSVGSCGAPSLVTTRPVPTGEVPPLSAAPARVVFFGLLHLHLSPEEWRTRTDKGGGSYRVSEESSGRRWLSSLRRQKSGTAASAELGSECARPTHRAAPQHSAASPALLPTGRLAQIAPHSAPAPHPRHESTKRPLEQPTSARSVRTPSATHPSTHDP